MHFIRSDSSSPSSSSPSGDLASEGSDLSTRQNLLAFPWKHVKVPLADARPSLTDSGVPLGWVRCGRVHSPEIVAPCTVELSPEFCAEVHEKDTKGHFPFLSSSQCLPLSPFSLSTAQLGLATWEEGGRLSSTARSSKGSALDL